MYVSTIFGKRGRDVSNNLVFSFIHSINYRSEFLFGKQATSSEGESMVYMRKIIRILLCGGGISCFKFLYPNCGILTAILTLTK